MALWTCGWRAHYAAAVAVRAGIQAGDVQPHHRAANRVPEAYVHLVFKIGAALWLSLDCRAAASATSKDAGEYVAEAAWARPSTAAADIRKIKAAEIKALCSSSCPPAGWTCSEPAGAKSSAARVSLSGCGIDIV